MIRNPFKIIKELKLENERLKREMSFFLDNSVLNKDFDAVKTIHDIIESYINKTYSIKYTKEFISFDIKYRYYTFDGKADWYVDEINFADSDNTFLKWFTIKLNQYDNSRLKELIELNPDYAEFVKINKYYQILLKYFNDKYPLGFHYYLGNKK